MLYEDFEGSVSRRPKEKGQNDKQRSTKKNTIKSKDQVRRSSLKPGSELMCSGRIGSSCSTSGTRRATLATNQVIRHFLRGNKE